MKIYNPPVLQARKRHLQRLVRWIVPKVFLAFGFLADMAGRKSITTDMDEIAATAILRTIGRKTCVMDDLSLVELRMMTTQGNERQETDYGQL